MIPFIIVEATLPPNRKAPENSITAAIKIACLIVRALEPTDVANALATSFAPTDYPLPQQKYLFQRLKKKLLRCNN